MTDIFHWGQNGNTVLYSSAKQNNTKDRMKGHAGCEHSSEENPSSM